MRTFLTELRRRRVFRTLALYIVGSWVLIQVAEVAFESWGIPATNLRYMWIGLALAFPAAALFGWRYDITSDGIVRTPAAGMDETQDLSLRRMDYGLIGALVLIVAVIGYGVYHEADEERALVRASERPGIAVMPFVDLTADGELAYFGAGIAEALLNALGHITEIDVIARTSSFHFQGSDASITEIADALDVDYVVEGSVNRDGETVHVGATLIDTDSGRQLWSGNFEGNTDEAFTAQQDIAKAVAGFLEMSLGDPRKHGGTTNFQAYEALLRANAERRDADLVMLLIDEALAHDPDYAAALTAKAWVHYVFIWQGLSAVEDAWETAAPLLDRALELAPEFVGAHIVKGGLQLMRRNDEEALALFERALELNPSSTDALLHLSRYYSGEGRHEESIAIAERNARLDPMDSMRHVQLANRLITAGHVERGVESYERAIELDPQGGQVWQQYIGRVRGVRGPVEALRLFARMQTIEDPPLRLSRHPLLLRNLGLLLGMIGDARGRAALELAGQDSESAYIAMDLGGIALREGRFEDGWRETWLSIQRDPSESMPAAWLVDFAIARDAGMEEVLAYHRKQWPELFAKPAELSESDPRFAVAVVRALRHVGDDEQADRVFEVARSRFSVDIIECVACDQGWRDQDQEALAQFLVLSGDYDAALSALEKHAEEGGQIFFRADYAPTVWAPIADHPRFIAVMNGVAEKEAAQRAEVNAMIERGELVIPTADDL